jgi:hypothetical protein
MLSSSPPTAMGAMRGRCIYRRRRARGPRKKAGRRRRGLRWRRQSTGGTIGFGFEGWESEAGGIDGTATAAAFGGRGLAGAWAQRQRPGRNGTGRRNWSPIDRITRRDATRGERMRMGGRSEMEWCGRRGSSSAVGALRLSRVLSTSGVGVCDRMMEEGWDERGSSASFS